MVRFKPGRVYMHRKAMDVALLVDEVTGDEINGRWMNLGYTGNPWIIERARGLKSLEPANWADITIVYKHKRSRPGLPL